MEIKEIKAEVLTKVNQVSSLQELKEIRETYLNKKGPIAELTKKMASSTKEERRLLGQSLNDLKTNINTLIEAKTKELNDQILTTKLTSEAIDITLPATNIKVGSPNQVEKVIEEIETLLVSMGYDVVEGPEVEKDLYNFELLNLPKGHPARDAQDSFYISDDKILLRSQTSPVQVRTMLANKEKTPIRIICPGKTYRRDNDDATHSHEFTQIEGLLVDKQVSLADLKGTFDVIAKRLFGEVETRFRPSYYPFTEPSVEMDVSCFNCHGKGCNICKGTGWITIGGAGMVHPNVLDNCGYDHNKYTGFAFGFGAERIAMLKYGITDIRVFYTNDLRTNFDRRDDE